MYGPTMMCVVYMNNDYEWHRHKLISIQPTRITTAKNIGAKQSKMKKIFKEQRALNLK